MKIIADEETAGIQTTCLAISWNLSHTCQVKGCNEKTYAILCFNKEETKDNGPLNVTICKKHYDEGKEKGTITFESEKKKERASNEQQAVVRDDPRRMGSRKEQDPQIKCKEKRGKRVR